MYLSTITAIVDPCSRYSPHLLAVAGSAMQTDCLSRETDLPVHLVETADVSALEELRLQTFDVVWHETMISEAQNSIL